MKIKARLDSFELREIIFTITLQHRRRIETEGKAKIVASVWGANFLNFFAALAVLYLSIWKKQFNSTVSFKSTETKQLAPMQTDATTFSLPSVSILLLCLTVFSYTRLLKILSF